METRPMNIELQNKPKETTMFHGIIEVKLVLGDKNSNGKNIETKIILKVKG
jgi:hypothetical protein